MGKLSVGQQAMIGAIAVMLEDEGMKPHEISDFFRGALREVWHARELDPQIFKQNDSTSGGDCT